ncbi:MAG: L-cysteine:1D-myo-inositol 2-amino-2-deoxy-alpha-D-glucopyranoside ligase [Frankiaceae bacterium]|nr:L-cysteine:1D-myo-inositol 2-amino-2-deoxy-alpha-D-glucopyranoside ligase [Frankiaceae bacterium]
MDSWAACDVPSLPGTGVVPLVHDTASGSRVLSASGPTASLYVCGITPYDATHLGHAATYLAFDLLVRAWLDAGVSVSYTQNSTDIDDPLLERATATGIDWQGLAARETALFHSDMAALRVVPPAHYVPVTEAMPLVVELIERLDAAGATYVLDGDVYFSVEAAKHFGEVSGYDAALMRRFAGERGGDPDRVGKRDPQDCLLWLAQRPGEPGWPSPYGPGRPGWHVECTAIALDTLGPTIDVQGGGSDLIFPHHELSAAEAEVATGTWPFARAYLHAGMVAFEGEKMSKSRGNLLFVSRLLAAGADPGAIRLALLAHHYRSDWEWTGDELEAATARLSRWRDAVALGGGPAASPVIEAMRAHLADDLDAAAAAAAVDAWADAALAGDAADRTAPALVADAVDALFGIGLRPSP